MCSKREEEHKILLYSALLYYFIIFFSRLYIYADESPSVVYEKKRRGEWWRGFPVVICLTRRSAGLYKAESFALSSPFPAVPWEDSKWLVWISKGMCVSALLGRKEWKVKRHHIYLKMRLISASPSFPHTVWWGSNVGRVADLKNAKRWQCNSAEMFPTLPFLFFFAYTSYYIP
jgi:hypothetical protein